MSQTTKIELEHTFEAAHHLPDSKGLTTKKCLNLHGHTYLVRVFVEANQLTDDFVVDFGTIKRVIDGFDHATLVWREDNLLLDYVNTLGSSHYILDVPPTAENIAAEIYDRIDESLPQSARVTEIWVAEGAKPGKIAWVKYSEEVE